VRAGTFAPEWAKQLDGPPVAGKDTFNAKQGTLPRFWTPAFKQAYDHLQQLLVARYDATAEVAETQITRCMTFTAEPLIRQARTNETLRALVAAGFTSALDEQCQREQIEEHLVWQRTRSGLSFNPYQRVGADGKVTIDPAFAVSLMDQCRKVLGKRCVLENHSIRWPAKSSEYDPVYAGMDRLGAPISYQTATPDRIGDWRKTLQWAVDHHGNSVELNRGYPQYDLKNLETFAHALASNPPEG
jgi:predicted TIM-barrel fold metal-dependent hydrolase